MTAKTGGRGIRARSTSKPSTILATTRITSFQTSAPDVAPWGQGLPRPRISLFSTSTSAAPTNMRPAVASILPNCSALGP
jgi:hypothetical protein